MLDRLGSSIGSSFRPFEGYVETLEALKGILLDKSSRAVAKHPNDIRAMREDIINTKMEVLFGKFLDQACPLLKKNQNHIFGPKSIIDHFIRAFSPLFVLGRKMMLKPVIALTKKWLQFQISDRSIEKLLVKKDIESVFCKFTDTLSERIEDQPVFVHQKLTLPDLIDIQRTLKIKESFDHAVIGKLCCSTKEIVEKLTIALDRQSESKFFQCSDATTAALIKNISHEILETSHSERISAYWGKPENDLSKLV